MGEGVRRPAYCGNRECAGGWALGAVLGTFALVVLGGLPAVAEEAEKPLRIGVLYLGPRKVPNWHCGPRDPQRGATEMRADDAIDPGVTGLRDELVKLGYVEHRPETKGKAGRRFVLDIRQGNLEAVKRYAHQFAQERVDLIVAVATSVVRAAQEATRANRIPILFYSISDPLGEGFVQSLARPGGHITGVTTQLVQGSGKRVEIFKEMLPGLRRLMAIYKPDFRPSLLSMPEMREAAARLGIVLTEKHIHNRAELQAVLAEVRRHTVDGIIMPPDAIVFSNADLLLETSLERRVPAFGTLDVMAEWGALGAYGPSPYQAGRRAATYVDKIVKGAEPGDLPVEPIDPTFVVNLKAAACLGVTVPPTVLHQADRVIR